MLQNGPIYYGCCWCWVCHKSWSGAKIKSDSHQLPRPFFTVWYLHSLSELQVPTPLKSTLSSSGGFGIYSSIEFRKLISYLKSFDSFSLIFILITYSPSTLSCLSFLRKWGAILKDSSCLYKRNSLIIRWDDYLKSLKLMFSKWRTQKSIWFCTQSVLAVSGNE